MSIVGVVLAAGGGTRLTNENKLLLPFRGRPVIYHAVGAALRSKLDPVLLVIGHQGEEIPEALGSLAFDRKLRVVRNKHWQTGRASSVEAALDKLPGDAPGALFLQGDMPLMTEQLINLVMDSFQRGEARICFPLYGGKKGHPVAFSAEFLSELKKLSGDQSGLVLVERHWEEALKLPLEDELTQFDLDTDQDYRRLLQLE